MYLPEQLFNLPGAHRWQRGYRLAFAVILLRQFHLARTGQSSLRLHRQNWTLATGYAWPMVQRRMQELVDDNLATWTVEETRNGTYATLAWSEPLASAIAPTAEGNRAAHSKDARSDERPTTNDQERQPRPHFPADDRYTKRRREEREAHRKDGHGDYAGVLRHDQPSATMPTTPDTTPHAYAPASDQIRSDQMDSLARESNPIQSDPIRESEEPTVPPLTLATAQSIPAEMEPIAAELRRDNEGWTEPEIVEALRRMVAKSEGVKRPLQYLRTTLKNLRAEWAQQSIVLLAQEKNIPATKTGERATGSPSAQRTAGTSPAQRPRIRAEGEASAPSFVGESPRQTPAYVEARNRLKAGGI